VKILSYQVCSTRKKKFFERCHEIMPNNRVKTKGALQGKKGASSKALHPNSRRAKQIIRIGLRSEKLAQGKKQKRRIEMDIVDRHLYFVYAMDPSSSKITLAELHELVSTFLNRLNDDIAAEVSERRSGRPKTLRHERLEAERDRGHREYVEGFAVPDLTQEGSVNQLRYWANDLKGNYGGLSHLRIVRVFKNEPEDLILVQTGVPRSSMAKAQEMDVDDP